MKKIFFIAILFMGSYPLLAQEPADALRYSWTTPSGTARHQAIGGAMGSLGGEITATFVNPAGLGFYRTGDFVLSPGWSSLKNKSTYYGHSEAEKKAGFVLGTSGIVIGQSDNRGRKKSSAFSIAINRAANFNSTIMYRGVNTQSSYSQKFLEQLQNDNIQTDAAATNYPFGTSLAVNTFWIDTANGWNAGNKTFKSLATPLLGSGGLIQENLIETKGGITEAAMGYGANINDKFYWGGAVGLSFLRYERNQTFTEADATDIFNGFDFASFRENLTSKGLGINAKLGLIYKPVEKVRLGLALHTPTFYTITDTYYADIVTDTEGYAGQWEQHSQDLTGYSTGEFSYSLRTPLKAILSGTYILNEVEDVRQQKGFITADVEYINYAMNSFTPNTEFDNSQDTKDYLRQVNNAIDNAYKGAINVRVGGELKFNTIMARLGAAYYGNPYKDLGHGENGNRFLLTGGVGYRHKGMFIDIAYVHNMGKDTHFAYRLQNGAFTGANIRNTAGQALLTLGFKL